MSEATATEERPQAEETRAEAPNDAAQAQGEVTQEAVIETAEDFLASLEDKGSGDKAPESVQKPAVDPEMVGRLAQEYHGNYRNKQAALDKFETDYAARVNEQLLEDGMAPVLAGQRSKAFAKEASKEAKDRLNEQYADGIHRAGYVAAVEAAQNEMAQMNAAITKVLGKDAKDFLAKNYEGYAQAFESVVEIARKGYVTIAEAKEMTTKGFNAGKAVGEHSGQAAKSPEAKNGTPAAKSNEPQSLREAEEMHAGMHASGRRITSDEMRAYTARFAGIRK